ncbi:MAG: outer membrane beta-barrel protein [Acidobacteriota bacterium]|nr:outer membrane beta-barrel protein [Acidobacteriota bacterium]
MSRRAFFLPAAILVLAVPAAAETRLSFGLKGGYAYAVFGDYNATSDGTRAVWTWLGPTGSRIEGETPKLHSALDLALEMSLALSPSFAVCLSVGHLKAKNGPFTYTLVSPAGATILSHREEPYARAVPIDLTVRFYPVAKGRLRVYLAAGAGIYFARFDRSGIDDEGTSYFRSFRYDTTAVGLGLHGGLGVEAALTKAFGLLLEIEGRYAPIDDFTGTLTWNDAAGQDSMSGTYYYYEGRLNIDEAKGLLFAADSPDSSFYYGLRKGVIDFSGFSVRAGLFVRI